MDRSQTPRRNQASDEVAVAAFRHQIHGRGSAAFHPQTLAQIEARPQGAVPLANENKHVSRPHRAEARAAVIVRDEAHRPHHRRRGNRLSIGLVVEADIAAHDREVESPAGHRHALDRADDLPHDQGLFRIAEIEVIGDRQGGRADGGEVAPGLRHGLLAPLESIRKHIAGGAVAGQGEGLATPVDADDGGVGARGGLLQGVGHDVAIILLPDPASGGEVWAADQLQDRGRPVGRERDAFRSGAEQGGRGLVGTVIEGCVLGQGG